MNEVVETWYETNSQEIKLIQYLIYHLKKSGCIIKTKKTEHYIEKKDTMKIETGNFDIAFK